MTIASIMVANGRADVSMLNNYINEYTDLIFGIKNTIKKKKKPKEELFDSMNGFRALFKENIKLQPKVGKKFDKEIHNVDLIDLIKSEKK